MSTTNSAKVSDSITLPIFNGNTSEIKFWQSSIRDYAAQLDLENLLLQEIRFPGAAAADIPGDTRDFHRAIVKPPFPLESVSDAKLRFYDIKSRACLP